MVQIHFFEEDTSFKPVEQAKLRQWIDATVTDHNRSIGEINYIFTSDSYLLDINKQYLNHNTFTDIITFNNSQSDESIEADIFISIDRVRENATKFRVSFEDELHRVMIHGVLHLLGHDDKTEPEKLEMRKKENHYLALRF